MVTSRVTILRIRRSAKNNYRLSQILSSSLSESPASEHHPDDSLRSFIPELRVVCRKVYCYVRYDLKEIAFPSSLPNPPHIKPRKKLTWKERYLVLKEASRLYCASWVRDIGPDLRPNDYKNGEEYDSKSGGLNGKSKEKEPSTLEDLAIAAKGGMETLRPVLQRLYMTRASAYKDALKSFIQGYQEGIQQTMEKKGESRSEENDNDSKKSS
ncbi:LOW QUALITY PROTEIN: hypothetical protein V2J09_006999 [Rumex salicifolius]